MIRLIDPKEKYLKEYKEAYILSLKEIKQGNISKHDLMFENPDEKDIITNIFDSRDQN